MDWFKRLRAEWYTQDIKERCARNVGRNGKGQFASNGKANWKALLGALARGERMTPREMSRRFGWQADRLLREKGLARKVLDNALVRVRFADQSDGQRLKWIDPMDLEKLRALLGQNVDVEV